MVIGINSGHTVSGQPGCGAVGYLNESDETRAVAAPLIKKLKSRGHTVYNCTNDYAHTTLENLSEIVKMANSKPLDLFVSIHFNSGGGNGCEVFTNGAKRYDEADRVCENLGALGFRERGIKDGSGLYVIRHTNARAMLIEVCFTDSKSDAGLYRSLGAEKIADAICNAICHDTEELTLKQYEELRNEIQTLKPVIYDYIDGNMPEWARPSIKKLCDRGFIAGDEQGRLGLTMEMIRMFVVLDKVGLI